MSDVIARLLRSPGFLFGLCTIVGLLAVIVFFLSDERAARLLQEQQEEQAILKANKIWGVKPTKEQP